MVSFPTKNRRKSLVIDRPTQLAVVFSLVGAVGFVVVSALTALVVLPEPAHFEEVSGERIRWLLVQFIAGFFLVNSVALALVALVLTHRIVGPEGVLRRALEGIREGDFGRRTKIRRKDLLQGLSQELGLVCFHLAEQRALLKERHEAVAEALDSADLEGAREALASAVQLEPSPKIPAAS